MPLLHFLVWPTCRESQDFCDSAHIQRLGVHSLNKRAFSSMACHRNIMARMQNSLPFDGDFARDLVVAAAPCSVPAACLTSTRRCSLHDRRRPWGIAAGVRGATVCPGRGRTRTRADRAARVPPSVAQATIYGAAPASDAHMSHRTVRDPEGVAWEVWEVRPAWAERRVAARRVPGATAEPASELRRGHERRQVSEARPRVGTGLEAGWLVFASAFEKRRVAPIPIEWEALPDETLVGLSKDATSVQKPRRRLIE